MKAVDWPSELNKVPKEVFCREDVFEREMERIYKGPQWHPVAHQCEVPNPGDYKTMHIGPVPVLVVRGDDRAVRVFVNSCPHRGTQLKTCSRGTSRAIECPYHRWAFNTRGELLGAPGLQDFPAGFRKEDNGLKSLRTALLHGVVFTTLSAEVADLETYLGGTPEYIARALGGDGRLKLMGYQKVTFATNWKEYSDNEGYHAPLLHGAFRLLQWQGGKGVQFIAGDAHKVTAAELGHAPDNGFLNDPSLIQLFDRSRAPQSIIVALFPVSLILKHLDVMTIRYAIPRSPDSTEVHYAYFSHVDDSPELERHRLRQASNLLGPSGLISLEDGAVFNRLHVGAAGGGTANFQKGVGDLTELRTTLAQNDEAGNLVRWEHYRKLMGFDRG
ncbi:MAG TPA: aromatic ring-hydroxylating dioxygenase subunit alpha [Ramlibacter sp.]|uniref:aromatic ring-hydroxylating oxygenase subunit alpha n=1 Tax=Ramlibacter sp. TaxID=1917967 RepID=UPI002C4D824F|nr:aromatic ring-hydroxylating dioxygenase subunit alpha [Ramlibacter sp.]HVZ46501.1 aromatic ring-hydroxylating dioxygenase subunit alpha [Ramlibacter sp.]